jgi:hypothetical protein
MPSVSGPHYNGGCADINNNLRATGTYSESDFVQDGWVK